MNEFKNNILQKIKAGEIDMKPRWHFVLKGLLFTSGVVITFLLAAYLLSLVIFVLKQSGVGTSLFFGSEGVLFFLLYSPWLLILCVGIFLSSLYVLVSYYSFSYKNPFIYSLSASVIGVVVLAIVFGQITLHEKLEVLAGETEVPIFSRLYETVDERRENLTVGTVIEVTDSGLEIETRDGTVIVEITPKTKKRAATEIKTGEIVFVYGRNVNGTIKAFGVHPAPKQRGERIQKPENTEKITPPPRPNR